MRQFAIASLLALWAAPGVASPMVCLQAYRIDHTEVPDNSTILFHMRDRSVYRAHMINRCIGLAMDPRGFTYVANPGTDEICSNLLSIRLNSHGGVCIVGRMSLRSRQNKARLFS